MPDATSMPWYCRGSLPAIRSELVGSPRGYYKVWDGTSSSTPKWVVLVAEGTLVNGYKVAVGDNGKCKFANKEFDDISGVVDFIKLRPLQGKDGHELRLKRDDDEPDQRRRTARSAGPGARGARPTSSDRAALAAQFNQGAPTRSTTVGNRPTQVDRARLASPQKAVPRSGSDSAPTRSAGGSKEGGQRARPSAEDRQKLLDKFNGTAAKPAKPASGHGTATMGRSAGKQINKAARMKEQGFSKTLPTKKKAPPKGAEHIMPRSRGGKVGMSLKTYEGEGRGLVILKIDPNTDAADTQPPLKPGMRIISVNDIDTATQPSDVRQQFQAGVPLTLRVDMPADAPRGLVSTATVKQQKAIYIAPLDPGAFDKLDVRITSPQEIPPFARGKLLNRYWDILPSPLTMVRLPKINNDDTSTYINANFVRSYGGRRAHEYIAAQGPLPATVATFIRMLWEQQVKVVVQTTGFIEKGTKKCEIYLPQKPGEVIKFDHGYSLAYDDVIEKSGYKVSYLKMSNGSETRNITHFWFNTWPDHGVPTVNGQMFPDNAVEMIMESRKVRQQADNNQAPLVVHCSAGVGRTGTFIIIDQVITALSMNDNKIDINGLVEEIREDRMALVQHTIQYKFAYQACVFYATKSQKGKEIFALESKKGGGIGRARRESMKPGGQYTKSRLGGKEAFKLSANFVVEEEAGDSKGFMGSTYDGDTAAKMAQAEKERQTRLKTTPLEKQAWFRTGFTRAQVEELLEHKPKGTFVVRESTQAGCFTLSMITGRAGASKITSLLLMPVVEGGVTQYRSGGKGTKLFPSVVDLVNFHIKTSGIKSHARGKSFKVQLGRANDPSDDEDLAC